MNSVEKGIRTVVIGVLANTILAVVKIVSGVVGNSYALIADGIESTTDIISSIIVWGGLKIASIPPDDSHPYGHGKAESLSALVVSIALLTAAVLIAYQSILQIINPEEMPELFTIFVLLGVIITKEVLFRKVFAAGEEANSTSLKVDAWHHRSDAITSAAAFVGILIAILSGYSAADDWAALIAAFIICYNGIRMMNIALHEIMDAATPKYIEDGIRDISSNTEGIIATEKCFVRKSGFHFIVDIHIIVDASISVAEGHQIAHNFKDKLLASKLSVSSVMVHVEPNEYSLEPHK